MHLKVIKSKFFISVNKIVTSRNAPIFIIYIYNQMKIFFIVCFLSEYFSLIVVKTEQRHREI